MAPKGEIAPIGSLKWWTTSRSAKTIQGAIVTIILGLGYEFHVIVEDWRAERRSVVTMSAELVNLIKENQTDRKRLLEMFERQVNILDALSRGQAQLTETSIEIRNMIKGKD